MYTDDFPTTGILEARLLTSTFAHARILNIDVSEARKVKGVKAVLTGAACPGRFGPLIQDRPALARDVVRYAGEPVALVVAMDRPAAETAVRLIKVDYEPLPAVLTPSQAMAQGAPL
ncbi:MAG: xanthine dehydrogenase family protein molybdopterin-binding subunit, partial [Lawsonibacter sp.]